MPRCRAARRSPRSSGAAPCSPPARTDAPAPAPQPDRRRPGRRRRALPDDRGRSGSAGATPPAPRTSTPVCPPTGTPTARRSVTTRRACAPPQAITVRDGVATITATADGTTGAMSWHPGQRYGRWEACVRMDPGPDALHGVLILWPVAEDFPAGGEIDWMEVFRGDRQEVTVNIHHGPPDRSFGGAVEHDATQWTAWAVEWTPEHITTYARRRGVVLDGPLGALPAEAHEHDDATRLVPARGRRTRCRRFGHAHGLGAPVGAARRASPPRCRSRPAIPQPASRASTPTASRARWRRAPDSWAAGGEKDLGPSSAAHDPCAPIGRRCAARAGTAAGRRGWAGRRPAASRRSPRRAPRRAAVRPACCSPTSAAGPGCPPSSRPCPYSPASSAAENVSPAPTVSMTFTATPGRRARSPVEVPATTPSDPSVTATSVGPRLSQSSTTCSGVMSGSSQWRSSELTLTTSASPEHLVHAAQDRLRGCPSASDGSWGRS